MALALDIPPPLTSGDRLTRREFERRYQAMPEDWRAELIEGIVYVASPVRFVSHGEPHTHIVTWLGVYCAATPAVRMGDNATVRMDPFNEVQPDALLRLEPRSAGRSRITDDDYIEGAPELIVEIAASSAAYDLPEKKRIYLRNGVQEYLVWQVYEQRLDWFLLLDDEYEPLAPDAAGLLCSKVFPGLQLNPEALLAGDLASVLRAVQAGTQTAEHAAFVLRLQTSASST
jgi:Uma2 family endonuclease